jgi:hypothetical protein
MLDMGRGLRELLLVETDGWKRDNESTLITKMRQVGW